jgi:tRNA(Ile)-lysidine synthase
LLIEAPLTKPLTLDEFTASLAALAPFESRPFLTVAVSGGPDSLALAILADRWARECGGRVCAVTVDHRLRRESGREIRLLHGWLSARSIRHEILAWSGDKPVAGIQEAARAARYRLLAEWCREHGSLHLLTAHHREDQAETHLIRRRARSGAHGLAGMSAIRELADCRILRPLLGVAKARLVALLDAERQPFITDPSNRYPIYERSRLRNDGAVPVGTDLEVLLAGIRTHGLARAVEEHERDRLLAKAVMLHPAGFAVLDPGLMLAAPHEITERVLSAIVATIGGKLYPARRERIARLRETLAKAPHRGHTLGGCRFVHWRERILVLRELARAADPVRLLPGVNCLWDCRFRLALPAAAEAVTVGYLGRRGVAELNRQAPRLRHGSLPRLVYQILPAGWDEEGIVAVPHLGYRRQAVAALPQVDFRPINPLSRASFTVV